MQYKEQVTSTCNHLAPVAFFHVLEHLFSCSIFYLLYIYLSEPIVRVLTTAINRAQVSRHKAEGRWMRNNKTKHKGTCHSPNRAPDRL